MPLPPFQLNPIIIPQAINFLLKMRVCAFVHMFVKAEGNLRCNPQHRHLSPLRQSLLGLELTIRLGWQGSPRNPLISASPGLDIPLWALET